MYVYIYMYIYIYIHIHIHTQYMYMHGQYFQRYHTQLPTVALWDATEATWIWYRKTNMEPNWALG